MTDPKDMARSLVGRILAAPRKGRRRLVAIAGAPASGKSTLAAELATALTATGRVAKVVPMDGFHLDNRLLEPMGLLSRKGAPETFDASGFVALMQRIAGEDEAIYPLFDRERDLAVAGAGVVEANCEIAIIEGNYLLFDENPWRRLAPLWDLSIWIDTPEPILLQRCVQRWLDHGHTRQQAHDRAEGNDMRNARRIRAARLPADVTLSDAEG